MKTETLDKLNNPEIVPNFIYHHVAHIIRQIEDNERLAIAFPNSPGLVTRTAQTAEDRRRVMYLLQKNGAIHRTFVKKLERREFMCSKGSKDSYAHWEVTNGTYRSIFETRKEADSYAKCIRKHGLDWAVKNWSSQI